MLNSELSQNQLPPSEAGCPHESSAGDGGRAATVALAQFWFLKQGGNSENWLGFSFKFL